MPVSPSVEIFRDSLFVGGDGESSNDVHSIPVKRERRIVEKPSAQKKSTDRTDNCIQRGAAEVQRVKDCWKVPAPARQAAAGARGTGRKGTNGVRDKRGQH